MIKYLIPLLFVSGLATASESSRLERAIQGAVGTAISVEYAHQFAPKRIDLAKHALAGGAISTVVGCLTDYNTGWKAGVMIGAGKEIVNDAILKREHPQIDDFALTAGAAIISSCLQSKFEPRSYFLNHEAEISFNYKF